MVFRPIPRRTLLACALFSLAAATHAADAEQNSTDPHDDWWDIHAQSTLIYQDKPGFSAQYSGQNSLSTRKERSYTFTNTVYLGAKPWKDGELFYNYEAGSGHAFSELTGTGGFTNGEITRVSGDSIKGWKQRLFLRQTWNLGGESEALGSEINQFKKTVDSQRIVLTLGNFSTLDVFDNNSYAKDPHTQFMNWGNMTYAAYDYAADARGYGWGFALEGYYDAWAARIGRMTGPKEPNMLEVDWQIGKHYGDQLELEHAHQLAGQPGKVRLLYWRNRANLASFSDAKAYLLANPGADKQAFFQVRNGEKFKTGLGLNLEQALSEHSGVFLRAMKTDGKTETYAFTEVDDSLALGLSVKGARWGRPQDTLGLAWLRNGLSRERRDYLKAGGISFFIGDGALNYRPETISEIYYSIGIRKGISITADYQHMENPGYNADRGPVSIGSIRLHGEF